MPGVEYHLCAQGMEFKVKPIFKGKMSDLSMPIATTLHYSLPEAFVMLGF